MNINNKITRMSSKINYFGKINITKFKVKYKI